MINQKYDNKLNEMRLTAMADSYRDQLSDSKYQELSFEERLGLMVDIEWSRRKTNKLARLIRQAQFRFPEACMEDIEYYPDRKLDKTQLLRLAACNYIQEKHNIIIMGAAGNGKTYMGCAFGVAACRNYYTVKYVRLPDLLNELAVARGEGVYQKVMKQYKKVSLLILDEWLLGSTRTTSHGCPEIVEARHQTDQLSLLTVDPGDGTSNRGRYFGRCHFGPYSP